MNQKTLAIGLLLLWLVSVTEAASFQGLGAGYWAALSGDGSTLAGLVRFGATPDEFATARWQRQGDQFVQTDVLARFRATSISDDGSVIVGQGFNQADKPCAARWTSATGITTLGATGGDWACFSMDVSSDGSVVVGRHESGAFRWTAEAGMFDLGSPDTEAIGCSSDGGAVIGNAGSGTNAFYWTADRGLMQIAPLEGFLTATVAQFISDDGNTVIGSCGGFYNLVTHESRPTTFFTWSPDTGTQPFAGPSGGDMAVSGISGDGSISLGTLCIEDHASGETVERSFLWDATHGTRYVEDELVALGLDLSGWKLVEAHSLSDDGTVIVGWGYNPRGEIETWVAIIPEPATLSLLAPGILVALRRRRSAKK